MVGLVDRLKWVRALRLTSRGEHQKVLEIIRTLPTNVRSLLLWSVMELQQYRELGNYAFAISLARSLVPRIEKSDRVSEFERKYLLAYVRWMGGTSNTALFNGDRSKLEGEFAVFWDEIDLDKVPQRLKRLFPLRAHPQW
jgi:hypothetical protein